MADTQPVICTMTMPLPNQRLSITATAHGGVVIEAMDPGGSLRLSLTETEFEQWLDLGTELLDWLAAQRYRPIPEPREVA